MTETRSYQDALNQTLTELAVKEAVIERMTAEMEAVYNDTADIMDEASEWIEHATKSFFAIRRIIESDRGSFEALLAIGDIVYGKPHG